MPSTMTMQMPLLPQWLRWAWVVALCVVLLVHLWHVHSMSGQARWWHVGHVVMAAGMITMFVVREPAHVGLYWGGVALFGALALAMVLGGAALWRRDRLLNWLWAGSTVDMVAMTYMALPNDKRDLGLTLVLVAYLTVEVVVWLTDPLPRMLARQVHTLVQRRAPELVPAADAGTLAVAATRPRAARPAVASDSSCESMRLVADVNGWVRVTLAVMSASMGWMLLAMQTMHMVGMPMPA